MGWQRLRCISVLQCDFVLHCTSLYLHQGICSICAGGNGWQCSGKRASQAGFASASAKPQGSLDWFADCNTIWQPSTSQMSMRTCCWHPSGMLGANGEKSPVPIAESDPNPNSWLWDVSSQPNWGGKNEPWRLLCLVFSMQGDEWILRLTSPALSWHLQVSACASTCRQQSDATEWGMGRGDKAMAVGKEDGKFVCPG